MGLPSYMRYVVDRKVVMRRILYFKLCPYCISIYYAWILEEIVITSVLVLTVIT